MNYQDIENEERKRRASPDDDADAELARLWYRYLRSEGVAEEHITDPNVRYWKHLDAEGVTS